MRNRVRIATLAGLALIGVLLSGASVGAAGKPAPPITGGAATKTAPPPTGGTFPPLTNCPIFPATNVWNRRVDSLPVAVNSSTMIAAMGSAIALHPDFSAAHRYGIPYNVVGPSTPRSAVTFLYDDESDHVGYPVPPAPIQERGSDHHILMVDTTACRLYELFDAAKNGSWTAGSGSTWDLTSNALRPDTWTSADAAGLPIFPGLVRFDEIRAGQILHALRFTAPTTCNGYLYPARHEAGSTSCSSYPPMGLRVRMKASVNITGFAPDVRVLLQAMKTYGMLLADNGSAWYVSGAPDRRWNDDVLHTLNQVHGSDFEVVDTTGFVNG